MVKKYLLLLVLFMLPLSLTACRPEDIPVQITLVSTADYAILTPAATPPAGENLATNDPLPSQPTPAGTPFSPTIAPLVLPTRIGYEGVPTPDAPHYESSAAGQKAFIEHTVLFGETLSTIAAQYGISLEELLQANGLSETDFVYVGQIINIPTDVDLIGPELKLIPDSELVYGPATKNVDIRQLCRQFGGYINQYREVVEGRQLSGPEIVELVAVRFSINPRLLLSMLEYRTGWVTQSVPPVQSDYLFGKVQAGYEGLYRQLSWAADELNYGFYGRSEGGLTSLTIADNTRVGFHPQINDGTAGVQRWLAAHDTANYERWLVETSANGFFGAYLRLFGNPFGFAVEPLWPEGLTQPPLKLPWEKEVSWYFTGGPHGGWGSGSAWASLDFAPDKDKFGCYVSEQWAAAAANGVVVFSHMGGVIIDLDGDGHLGTGWTLVYWHIDSFERVAAGTRVEAGDRIGHASCEGGFSNGAHIHFARRYNGRWVAADGSLPFNLNGWVSSGLGREYDGLLTRDGASKEACVCAEEGNSLTGE